MEERNGVGGSWLDCGTSMSRRKWWIRVAIAGVAAVACWIGASVLVIAREMRRGKPRFEEPVPLWVSERGEGLRLSTRDGESLGAWFVDARREEAARVFEGDGCAVLLVTHRAHGDSTGERDDFGWSARLDVVAAVEWLETRRPAAPIVVCGMSMGAAAATFAGGELGERVDGYVLECLYRDLDSAAWCRAEIHLPPLVDWIGYAGMRLAGEILLPDWRAIAPIDAVGAIPREVPVLLLAGTLDRHAPLEDAREIHARIADHAELVTLESAHGRLLASCPDEYARAVLDFVREVERRAGGSGGGGMR